MTLALLTLLLAQPTFSLPDTPVAEWSPEQVEALLTASPWAQAVEAHPEAVGRDMTLLPPEHPFHDPLTADVLAWGPGAEAKPGIGAVDPAKRKPAGDPAIYHVRWTSARVVREALLRETDLAGDVPEGLADALLVDDDLRYHVTLVGPKLEQLDAVTWEQFVPNVRLAADTGAEYTLINVRTPRDHDRGSEAVFIFDRINASGPVTSETETVSFRARLGDALVEVEFRPAEMQVGDRVDIVGPVTTDPKANPLRAFELVLFQDIDRDFRRALRRVEVRPGADDTLGEVVVVYDAGLDDPADGSRFEERMFEAALRTGRAPALPGKLWFVDVKSGRQAYVRGEDCRQLASVSPRSGRVLFPGVVRIPRKKK